MTWVDGTEVTYNKCVASGLEYHKFNLKAMDAYDRYGGRAQG